jgi:hypothetical protein
MQNQKTFLKIHPMRCMNCGKKQTMLLHVRAMQDDGQWMVHCCGECTGMERVARDRAALKGEIEFKWTF